MTLPVGFGYTTIQGKYISAVLDSTDPDREPDVVPLSNLTVTLTPSVSLIKSLTDPPVTVILTPIITKTDVNGEIVGPDGQVGVVIVSGDFPDPDNPWTYAVSVTGVGVPKMSFNIAPLAGETLDLTSVLEAPSNPTDLSAWTALSLQVSADADRAEAAAAAAEAGGTGAVSSVAGRTGDVVLSSNDLTDATVTGKSLLDAADAVAARTAISAGTSNVTIGTTSGTAADAAVVTAALAGKEPTIVAGTSGQYYDGTKTWKPLPAAATITADSITDATVTGKALVRAADAPTARTAIGAGTSNLAIGTTSSTAKAGNYQPTAANISDATATGRSVLTAADAAAARTVIGITNTAYDTVPDGTVFHLYWDGTGTQPLRPSSRTTIKFEWEQATAPPVGSGYALAHDEWQVSP